MTALPSLKPRDLGTLPSRLSNPSSDGREHNPHWRKWYSEKVWRNEVRPFVLKRDLYTCQQTGVLLLGKHPAPDSPVVHHKKPHRGNRALFFDPNNCEAVSKAWHDSEGQAIDKANPEPAGCWY